MWLEQTIKHPHYPVQYRKFRGGFLFIVEIVKARLEEIGTLCVVVPSEGRRVSLSPFVHALGGKVDDRMVANKQECPYQDKANAYPGIPEAVHEKRLLCFN